MVMQGRWMVAQFDPAQREKRSPSRRSARLLAQTVPFVGAQSRMIYVLLGKRPAREAVYLVPRQATFARVTTWRSRSS